MAWWSGRSPGPGEPGLDAFHLTPPVGQDAQSRRNTLPHERYSGQYHSAEVLCDLCLSLDPACREYAFGIAVGLLTSFENQIARRLECDIAIGVIPKALVARVAGVLLIDHARHIFQCR